MAREGCAADIKRRFCGIEFKARTRRRRLYSGNGLTIEPSALDRRLSALDPSWHEHVARLVCSRPERRLPRKRLVRF